MEPKAKHSGTPAGIRESLKKATTEMLVLHLLGQKPMYTYEMMSQIQSLSGGTITFNTLYLSIYRLQDFGFIKEYGKVVSEDNRVRIYFTITEAGAAYLEQITAEYLQFTSTVDQILNLKRKEPLSWSAQGN